MKLLEIKDPGAFEREFRAAIARERREARQAARLFVEACKSGDIDDLHDAIELLNSHTVGGWPAAMRGIASGTQIHPDVAAEFLTIWIQNKSMLDDFDDVLILVKGLRAMFPVYTGADIKVFRGERLNRSRRGRVGISWTTDITVAEAFAMDSRRCSEGGSCLIETTAPAAAIIGMTETVGDFYNEKEILIDRRGLKSIGIVKHFPQISHDEYFAYERAKRDATP